MTQLILASSSRYRQAQFAALGITITAVAPDVDESPQPDETADALCLRLALAKAQAVAARYPDALVIGSDQVACVPVEGHGQLLGKPGNYSNAVEQLRLCQDKTVEFFTAICVCGANAGVMHSGRELTKVHFRPLSDHAITRYVRSEQPYDCAGSFKSEGKGILLFDAIESRDPNSLIGLPVMLLRDLLLQSGVDLLELATA